ncbi:Hypothetical predicted protein [Olea europaea subsp. europaea]|uniref:Uncharacterized protein n=1 Tax=Olea europaea subsp. europaea TaxID=158383 RepID=A0A8S0RPL2_OLEEU|nr:Hypothetical predicted protein [Olea europaea subsp. europaea]
MLSDAGILRFTRLHDVLRMQQKAMLHAQVSHNTVSKSTLAMCEDGPATARNVCLILSSMSNEDLVATVFQGFHFTIGVVDLLRDFIFLPQLVVICEGKSAAAWCFFITVAPVKGTPAMTCSGGDDV